VTLINDIVSVEAFVKARFTTSTTVKQTVPLKPAANTFVIRLQSSSSESETAYHFRNDREYQIVYYGDTALDVLTKLDTLTTALEQTRVIPINGSLRYIRVGAISVSMPFKTDNDLYAAILVVSTEVRQARTQEAYAKMAQVNAKINV
jgi:hypothetical protein